MVYLLSLLVFLKDIKKRKRKKDYFKDYIPKSSNKDEITYTHDPEPFVGNAPKQKDEKERNWEQDGG